MNTKKQIAVILLLMFAVITLGGWLSNVIGNRSSDYYHQLRKNYGLFGSVFEAVTERYVEEVDPDKFVRAAIDGMINQLDPYTVYFETEENDDLQIMTSGKYGGIGTRIGIRNGWCTVVEQPFDGKPAFRAGIREGDQIIEVDGESTKGESVSETASRLRGKPGTEVVIKVHRMGEPEPLQFRLIRDNIVVEDVNCSTIIEGDVGYIRLTRFGRNAGDEVKRAILSLKEQGMQKLIFDLRSNPGGLLETAVEVADNFIDKGETIVYTKGRWKNADRTYRAKTSPVLEDLPLVVLVDRYSASASEIVAGAVQDLDRGVVIGMTTYGKGLVQTVVGVGPNSALKVTSSKYYIPSGRLIQRLDVFNKGPRSVFLDGQDNTDTPAEKEAEEDQKEEYFTSSGRVVHGGGGVKPDVEVIPDTLNRLEFALLRQSMFFNFALQYVQNNPDLSGTINIDQNILTEFQSFLKEKEFEFKVEGENELLSFEKIATDQGYGASLTSSLDEIKKMIEIQKEKEFDDSIDYIQWSLEREIVAKIHGTEAGIITVLDNDETVQKAVEILESGEKYSAILKTNSGASS